MKLNNVGHNITSIMKRLNGWGTDFFLRSARKFPRFPEDIPEISWKYRNSPFSHTGRDFRPGLLQSCHTEPGKIVPDSAKGYSGLRSAKLRWHLKKIEVFVTVFSICTVLSHPTGGEALPSDNISGRFFSRVEKPSDDIKSCLFLINKKGLKEQLKLDWIFLELCSQP